MPEPTDPRIAPLLAAWFGAEPENQAEAEQRTARWFKAEPAADREIEKRFAQSAEWAARGELEGWRTTPEGRLALILLFDQIPRQLHRGTAEAFAHDARALELALTGIERSMDLELGLFERAFFYMPLQHAESLPIQELSVGQFTSLGADSEIAPFIRKAMIGFADFARLHRDIIARFGRFPHRNRAQGRESTPEERAFLEQGGPSFGQ